MGGCVRILGMNSVPKLILASNSPRRKQLLALTGREFEIHPANVDETLLDEEEPGDYVVRLAVSKAREIAEISNGSGIILAADTTVVDKDAILGKPIDNEEATSMLRGLRGHTHRVYSGLALCHSQADDMVTDLCVTDVPMRNFSDEEMHTYVQSGDPLDKAGAYAIQHPHFQPVENLLGCFASVMGLPLCHLERSLSKLGSEPRTNIAAECQSALNYDCPIWQAVLNNEPLG
jgi:septum formation protein